jgi:dienelactone hydrolase
MLRETLEHQGVANDIKLYPGAAHSFFTAGPAHHEPSAQDSWRRVVRAAFRCVRAA